MIDALIEQAMDEKCTEVAPGVDAWIVEDLGQVEILAVRAQREGTGAVGRWLDSLPRTLKVTVPNVTSDRLAGMLERRGFRLVHRLHDFPVLGLDWMRVWVRDADA